MTIHSKSKYLCIQRTNLFFGILYTHSDSFFYYLSIIGLLPKIKIIVGSSGVSPANSIPAINEILVTDENNGLMEISFHVPNLRETKLGSR